MVKNLVTVLLGLSVMFCATLYAGEDSLFLQFKGKEPVKVFVKGFTNDSGKEISADLFKDEVEKAFAGRKSLSFTVVAKPEESDVQVSGTIKKFQYLEHGPLKPSPSIGTTALDIMATATENYVEMEVRLLVIDTTRGRTLWIGTVSDYIKQKMSEKESIPIIFDKIARACVARPFAKPKSR